MKRISIGLVVTLALILPCVASADTLAQWTFQRSTLGSTDPNGFIGPTWVYNAGDGVADGGVFAATSPGWGTHVDPNTGYYGPAGNGSTKSMSSNRWAIGDYYEFQTESTGYKDITITWAQLRSSTGPATFNLQWSTDGSTWTTLVANYTVLSSPSWSATTPQPGEVYAPVAGPTDLNNQAELHFRMTASAAPSGTAGTCRVDDVIISGTLLPEPTSLALLGLGLATLLRRR